MAKKSRSTYRRVRQADPRKFDRRSFRTKPSGKFGVKVVVGCPKGRWHPKAKGKQCDTAMRIQSILMPKKRR